MVDVGLDTGVISADVIHGEITRHPGWRPAKIKKLESCQEFIRSERRIHPDVDNTQQRGRPAAGGLAALYFIIL